MIAYSYILLKYIHDTLRGEAVNVGVLFYAPEKNYISFQSRDRLADLEKLFIGFKAGRLRKNLKELDISFSSLAEQLLNELNFKKTTKIEELAYLVLPDNASSLQWGRIGSGITEDITKTLQSITDEYVQQPTSAQLKSYHTRNDQHVWRTFSKELEKRNLLSCFKQKIVAIGKISETIEHTYKNGKLHCLQPLSLDLTSEEGIKEKAFRQIGRYSYLSKHLDVAGNSQGGLKVYYLITGPQEADLQEDYLAAQKILKESDTDVEIFTEEQAKDFSEYLITNLHLSPAVKSQTKS